MDREREREERKTRKAALSHQQQKHTNGGRANAHIPPAPDGAACFTGGWGFLYLAVGTVRRSRVYTRRLAALCMFAVAEENLNQLPPPIYPPYLCLPLSLSLSVPPPFSGFNPGFFFRHATFLLFSRLFSRLCLSSLDRLREEDGGGGRRRRRGSVEREGILGNRRGGRGRPSIGIKFETT